ncbi:MAG TPA: proteasome subunit beta [Acidimicrobiales bacterium]|nr:proteasome subunit beta [Acidimicrobiales bacterium]
MSLPLFPPGDDPGPSFAKLLSRTSGDPAAFRSVPGVTIPHGTTIAAVRFDKGVVMAGDRRATEGHSIAHRSIEKVFPADRHSAVAIAGAAGPAIEMVKLFQTQLEHYEKVEGAVLSLDGKANQLGQMVRANLPAAMEGLVVVPLFAGYDLRRKTGRIFTYDVTGGRYEETDFHATGSGGRDAKTTIKLGYREAMSRDEAVQLLVKALYQAADEDSATGGPDPLRGIYPIVATVDEGGFQRLDEDSVAAHFAAVLESLGSVSPGAPATAARRRTKTGDQSS